MFTDYHAFIPFVIFPGLVTYGCRKQKVLLSFVFIHFIGTVCAPRSNIEDSNIFSFLNDFSLPLDFGLAKTVHPQSIYSFSEYTQSNSVKTNSVINTNFSSTCLGPISMFSTYIIPVNNKHIWLYPSSLF